MKNKFLIVGQGLSGTIMADHLLQKGQSVVIIDECLENTSSKVAGGVVNPITGKRFSISWKAKELIPFAQNYYKNKEANFGQQFYTDIPIYRMFSSFEDENNFMLKTSNPDYDEFLSQSPIQLPHKIKGDFGGFEIKNGGWLNTVIFLDLMKSKFEEEGVLKKMKFDFDQLSCFDDHITYGSVEYDYIIFCEGYIATENPHFNWLPFNLAKGETLKIESDEIPTSHLINKNGFLLPLSNNKFNLGATFTWKEINESITTSGKDELIQKIEKITSAKYRIVSQSAGVRPTVKDRRPFIGRHPNQKNMLILNGMGSKGVSQIPFFANQLTEHILHSAPIDSEANVERYYPQ